MCSINGSFSKSYQVVMFPRGRFFGHYDFCYTPTIFQLNRLSNCEPRMYADDTHLIYACDNADNIQYQFNMRFYCFTQLSSSDCKARSKCAATACTKLPRKSDEWGARMAQWCWERSPHTNVTRLRFWPTVISGLSLLFVLVLFQGCFSGYSDFPPYTSP